MNTILQSYLEKGLLYNQAHPTLDLTIWNYSETVQFQGMWDEITLMCRGLVTNSDGKIVARPFRKFFNIEEGKHIPTSDFEVHEKMDGSLGLLFYYDGNWVMATRGSFTSDQAVKGMEMLSNYDYNKLHKDYTYLFEIIYPENRIVCSYDFEDVILLGVINTETGYEVDLYGEGVDVRLKNLINNLGFKVVKKYDGISDYSVLKQMVRDDAEGFVVRFSNGDRIKVKGVEYIRLHKIMTGLSTTSVWECLSKGDDLLTIIKDVPDEFYNKVSSYSEELLTSYNNIKTKCLGLYSEYRYGNEDLEPTRREYVDFVLTHPKELQGVLFNMWDGKTYDHIIWKQLKPEFMKL